MNGPRDKWPLLGLRPNRGPTNRENDVKTFATIALAASTICAAFAGLAPTAAAADPAKPVAATDMLFERRHLDNVPVGQKLAYRFDRTVSKPDVLGRPFADDITIDIKQIADDKTREVAIKVFTGERARDVQVIDGMTGNPILVVFLDRSVASYMAVAGGKLPYLKERYRAALRDRATVEPVTVKLADKTVPGSRITITPYSGDPNASRMQGYENSRFQMVVSDAVPGHFVELVASYENTNKDAPTFVERVAMVGAEIVK